MYVYSNWKFECNMWCGAAAVAVALMMDGTWKREREREREGGRGRTVSPQPTTECANKRGLEGHVIGSGEIL